MAVQLSHLFECLNYCQLFLIGRHFSLLLTDKAIKDNYNLSGNVFIPGEKKMLSLKTVLVEGRQQKVLPSPDHVF